MAVHHLPPRPTVANPERKQEFLQAAINEIDAEVHMLFCVADCMDGSSETPEEAIEAVKAIHKRLRRHCNALLALM